MQCCSTDLPWRIYQNQNILFSEALTNPPNQNQLLQKPTNPWNYSPTEVTFVEEHHYFLEGLHEVDVVITILLNLQQKSQLWLTLGCEGSK